MYRSIWWVPTSQVGKGAYAMCTKFHGLENILQKSVFMDQKRKICNKKNFFLWDCLTQKYFALTLLCYQGSKSFPLYGTNGFGDLCPWLLKKMEDSETLDAPFELLEAVDIMLQNCLHQNTVVHWDLKSMNILVKCDEHERHVSAKVADFGLSKRKESSCTYTKLDTRIV